MKLTNKQYDTLKLIALLIVPICALVSSVASALGYDATVVVTILTAVDTFLGAVVKIASDKYNPEDEQ